MANTGDADLLPSYEAATSYDPVSIIAIYIRREDLFNCSLVCRAWHDVINDELWGEPAASFGFGEKNPLGVSTNAFLLFLKALPRAPPSTRSGVHTLNLEKCLASIYTSLPDTWFSNLLVLLPELRRLLLPGISFLNHGSLLSRPSIKGYLPHQNLYHLNISSLTNTTSKSLVALFTNLTPELKVLDLSRTNSAGHPDVLRAIGSQLRNLRSLKLRWLKLSDGAISLLARGLQVRIERLDVTGNLLTDAVASDLLDWCFMPPEFEVAVDNNNSGSDIRIPTVHESDEESDAEFGDEEEWLTAKKLQRRETRSLGISLPDAYGNIPPAAGDKGLMHLHVSNNKITSYGIWKLLNSTRLRTLDCGTIQPRQPSAYSRRKAIKEVTTAITYYGFRKLRNLRIDPDALLINKYSGCEEADLLDISKLPRLKTLALTNIPSSTTDTSFVRSLTKFLNGLLSAGDTNLRAVVLEIVESEYSEMRFYDVGTPVTGSDTMAFLENSRDDFSFFEDEKDIPSTGFTGGTGSRKDDGKEEVSHQEEINTLDVIREWREGSRREGRSWKGSIKIMRDIGGAEASERGVEGNRWGVLVSELGL
ncbi:hypothetical protein ABW20_dc0110660 [Dactylellina cionopaga]|nr:hypothetical protein ABW20_dc0110660 [Dactylellina cionopaga]